MQIETGFSIHWLLIAFPGTVLLMSLQQFGYVATCGCASDGFDEGRDAIFPTHFLRHYLAPRLMDKKVRHRPFDSRGGISFHITDSAFFLEMLSARIVFSLH